MRTLDSNTDQPPGAEIDSLPTAEAQSSPARPLRVWPVFAIFFSAFAVCAAMQIPVVVVIAAVVIARGGKPQDIMDWFQTPLGFTAVAIPAQIGLLAVWWLASTYGDPRARGHRAIGKTTLSVPAYLCIAAASIAVLYVGGPLSEAGSQLFGEWQSDNLVATLYHNISWPAGIALILFIGLVPAFVEELFFRGYVQRRLLDRWPGGVVVPLVAVMFAAFHGTPAWALGVLPLGLWFGVLAWRTGSLWPGIVCHGVVNGSVTAWRVGASLGVLSDEAPPAVLYAFMAFVFGCLIVSAVILLRVRRGDDDYHRPAATGAPIASASTPHKSASDSTTTSGR